MFSHFSYFLNHDNMHDVVLRGGNAPSPEVLNPIVKSIVNQSSLDADGVIACGIKHGYNGTGLLEMEITSSSDNVDVYFYFLTDIATPVELDVGQVGEVNAVELLKPSISEVFHSELARFLGTYSEKMKTIPGNLEIPPFIQSIRTIQVDGIANPVLFVEAKIRNDLAWQVEQHTPKFLN